MEGRGWRFAGKLFPGGNNEKRINRIYKTKFPSIIYNCKKIFILKNRAVSAAKRFCICVYIFLCEKKNQIEIPIHSHKKRDSLTVLCFQGIGDSLITAFFLEQLKKSSLSECLTVICKKEHREVFEAYKCIDRLICNSALAEELYNKCIREKSYERDNNIINSALSQISPEKRLDSCINGYFIKVLKLSGEKKIVYPCVTLKKGKYLNDVVDKNTIIILPYAYSMKELSMDLWVGLVDRLNRLNFRVLTNIGNNIREKPIEGTRPYQVSLSEIFINAKEAYAVIGMRSGLMDWLACSGCNLLCVGDMAGGYWDLNAFSVKPVAYIRYNSENIEESIEQIVSILML